MSALARTIVLICAQYMTIPALSNVSSQTRNSGDLTENGIRAANLKGLTATRSYVARGIIEKGLRGHAEF